MKDINKSRENINKIDKKIASLFEERMNEAKEIAKYKFDNNLDIENKERETELIEKNLSFINSDELKDYYQSFEEAMFKISKNYQHRIISVLNDSLDNIRTITVEAGMEDSYPVYITKGNISNLIDLINIRIKKILIVTDTNIPESYIEEVKNEATNSFVLKIQAGEENKSIESYLKIMDALSMNKFTRSDAIVALGGGVIGDLAGFAASTYMRGIDFYNIPTSLLAMVDSSIGGKTAIDYKDTKNIVGAFYQPKAVLIALNTLKTLPTREFYNGLVESIKMAASFNKDLFNLIKNSNNLDDDLLTIIYESLKIKAWVVKKDVKEKNLRKALNFGHSLGHVYEILSKQTSSPLLHGEAVGIGMLDFSSDEVKQELKEVLKKYNLPTSLNEEQKKVITKENILDKLSLDKKILNNKLNAIYVKEIGSFEFLKLDVNEIIKED